MHVTVKVTFTQKHLRTASFFVGVFDPILGFIGFLPPIFTSPTHHVVVRSCFEFFPFRTNVLCSKIETSNRFVYWSVVVFKNKINIKKKTWIRTSPKVIQACLLIWTNMYHHSTYLRFDPTTPTMFSPISGTCWRRPCIFWNEIALYFCWNLPLPCTIKWTLYSKMKNKK